MYPRSTPEPSSLSHCSAPHPGYYERDYSASLSQADCLLGNCQNNGLEESQHIRGLPLHPSDPSHLYGSEYRPILQVVTNMPNEFQSCDLSFLLLEGLPHTRPELPLSTYPNYPDTLDAASTQYAYSAGWRGADRQMGQAGAAGMDNYNSPQEIDGVSAFPSSPESSSEITSDILSSPSAESYAQSGVQDDCADGTSFFREQMEGSPLGLARSVTAQEASRQRQQHLQKQLKKRKDMERKRAQRLDDGKTFDKICELLKIAPKPKKTLVLRILVGVAKLVGHDLELDCDLRCQLDTAEADITAEHAQLFAEEDACSSLPRHIDSNDALDSPDTGATPCSFPWSNGELDKTHN